jgi:hypothetical protein
LVPPGPLAAAASRTLLPLLLLPLPLLLLPLLLLLLPLLPCSP